MSRKSKEIHLKSYPEGMPTQENFELVEVEIPAPGEKEFLVKNKWMSVDPYMRSRMIDRKSYMPPFKLGQVMQAGAIGEVVESNSDKFAVGDHVSGMLGWREYYISNGEGLFKVDPNIVPLQSYLGTVGMPGLTAYAGLLEIGQPKEGETVFVSAAAGAVGSVVCQIARLKGCRVVASAGAPEKVQWLLEEAKVDAAINYKTVDNLQEEIAKACPKGIDVYFENVGGEHLVAALNLMNIDGRIPMCGMISQYNDKKPTPGPSNLANIIGKSLKVQGFLVSSYFHMLPKFTQEMATWIGEGKVKSRETTFEGLEKAPEAFLALFIGANFGKTLVKIS